MQKGKIDSKVSVLLMGLVLFGAFLLSGTTRESFDRQTENLSAFAKLYGYVKYFHPSDEAREINWDKFAIYGVHAVKDASDQKELQEILESLFLPIAPTLKMGLGDNQTEPFLPWYVEILDEDTTKLTTVVWQHLGVDLDNINSAYYSRRTNTYDGTWNKTLSLFRTFSAEELRGDRFKVKAVLQGRFEGTGSSGELFLAVDNEFRSTAISDTIYGFSCEPERWVEYEALIENDSDFTEVGIGVRLNGTGSMWIQGVEFKAQNGDWETVAANQPMVAEKHNGIPDGWNLFSTGGHYNYKIDTKCSTDGNGSLRLDSPPQLFEYYPHVGETIIADIGGGLWSEVPLAVYRNEQHTLPHVNRTKVTELRNELQFISSGAASGDDEDIRLANVIITWNIFQHFYPYFDVIDTDWEQQLTTGLRQALTDRTAEDFYRTLSKMLASLQDGHIQLHHPSVQNRVGLPFLVDWVEDQVVITHSIDENFQPGDIVQTVDGVLAVELIDSTMSFISGSTQLSLFRALRQFSHKDYQSEAKVTLLRGSDPHEFTVLRTGQSSINYIDREHLPVIEEIEDGIFYVDLDRASMTQIRANLEEMATAQGVIFDLRGYPNSNHEILRHLLAEPDTSNQWMQIPQYIYPDQRKMIGFDKRRWYLRPALPRIEGSVVFITDARAISYAESFLSYVEHYKLGEIVGQPTAGANGNINRVSLPGGYSFTWTGMKVLKHDGSQHHLIGIQPTVLVEKTIEGVREGKDEFLEKAIQIIQ